MEELDEKDLHCIARQLQVYVKKELHQEEGFSNFTACDACSNHGACNSTFVPYHAFGKLARITGVTISPMKGFKI